MMRAQLLATSSGDLRALSDALASVQSVSIEPRARAALRVDVLGSALTAVLKDGPSKTVQLDSVPAHEPELRDALEGALREQAALAPTADERIALVDRANDVRRWTTW
jgi:serine/threonine-protein kinase PknG